MTELELRQMFKNLSDCYADTGRFENDGSYTEGEVIQAMTEDRFIEALKEAKLLPIPAVSDSLIGRKLIYKGREYTIIDKHNTSDYVLLDDESMTMVGLHWEDVELVG